MIVACPSCSTRYRHSGSPDMPGSSAQCSRCDGIFPLAERKRTYLLREVEATASALARRMTIGMDDPTLAEKLRDTALDAPSSTSPQPLTYRVLVEDTPSVAIDMPQAAAPPVFESDFPPAPEQAPEPMFSPQAPVPEPMFSPQAPLPEPVLERPDPLSEPREQDEAAVEATKAAPRRHVLAVALPLGACTALAYGIALWQESDPIAASAIGATAGLLVGWACHQWIRQRSR